ncbi:hypothetical protein AAMO2058_000172200 [Amorphochlora amoebiformis]
MYHRLDRTNDIALKNVNVKRVRAGPFNSESVDRTSEPRSLRLRQLEVVSWAGKVFASGVLLMASAYLFYPDMMGPMPSISRTGPARVSGWFAGGAGIEKAGRQFQAHLEHALLPRTISLEPRLQSQPPQTQSRVVTYAGKPSLPCSAEKLKEKRNILPTRREMVLKYAPGLAALASGWRARADGELIELPTSEPEMLSTDSEISTINQTPTPPTTGTKPYTARLQRLKLDVDSVANDTQFWKLLGATVLTNSEGVTTVGYNSEGFRLELHQRDTPEGVAKGRTELYYTQLVLPEWRTEGWRDIIKQLGGEVVYSAKDYDEIRTPGDYLVKVVKGTRVEPFEAVTLRCRSVPSSMVFYSAVLNYEPSVIPPKTLLERKKAQFPIAQAGSAVLGPKTEDTCSLVLQRYRARVKPGPYPAIATVQGVKTGAYHAIVVSSPDVEAVQMRMAKFEKGELKMNQYERSMYRLAIEQTVGAEERLTSKMVPGSKIARVLDRVDADSVVEISDPDGHRIDVVELINS